MVLGAARPYDRNIRRVVSIVAVLAGVALPVSVAHAAVVLNEINCEGTDWIEIVNTGDDAADVSGWLLTDEPLTSNNASHRFVFAAGTAVPAHDELTVDKTAAGGGGFLFGISCDDRIRLADSGTATTPIDDVTLPGLAFGTDTWGRYPSGAPDSWIQTTATRGAPNEPSTSGGGPPPDPAWLFDPTTVYEIDLSLPQASRDALAADPEEYVDGTFALKAPGRTYGPYAVGVRLKGRFSFRDLSGKAAFKIKFNHSVGGQRFVGLEKLTLNNMVQDFSMLHEVIGFEAFRAVGVAAPSVGFAYVRVDGSDYGVYANVETMDRVGLGRWFATTQHLYEGEVGEDVTPGGAGAFEADEGSDSDRADLEGLIDAVADDSGTFWDRLDGVADLQQMVRMWATEKYIGHWDGYAGRSGSPFPSNYFLHSDAAGLFSMVPWGIDQALVLRLAYADPAGLLFNECLADATCEAEYADAVGEVRSTLGPLKLEDRAQQLAAVLQPWQAIDPRREQSTGQIANAVGALRAFLAQRPGDTQWLSSPPPSGGGGGEAATDEDEEPPPAHPSAPLSVTGPSLTGPPAFRPPAGPAVRWIVVSIAGYFDGKDPDAVAGDGTQPHPYYFDEAGKVTFVWQVPGTSGGAKSAKAKPVTIARGALTRGSPGWARVPVRITRDGRRRLRRAHRVRVTMKATFRPLRTARTTTAKRSFTLLDRAARR